jgi:UDP-2,4-diacetamido-2,4,6-trideoxy-beta-L-altropyranose hydrolase
LIVFRADASPQIGTGHVMRCLAFGQTFRKVGERPVFVMCMVTPMMRDRLESEGFEVKILNCIPGGFDDAKQTVEASKDLSSPWIVVDGYHFDATYQRSIKELGKKLLLIDDHGSASHYYADIVLNQNIYASEKLYSKKEPNTTLLLGTRYALLREEFLEWQGWKRKIPALAQNILVTLGGSDPENVTKKIYDAIIQLELNQLNVIIVTANNQYLDQMKCLIEKSKANTELKSNVEKMSDLMAWADIAVSAGGTSTWELAFMGVPMITLAIADNQCQIVEELKKARVAVNAGWHKDITPSMIAENISKLICDPKKRSEMSQRSQALVDGNGADRVLKVLRCVSSSQEIKCVQLRRVQKGDEDFLWHLANGQDVRFASFSTKMIPWEDHIKWFRKQLNDPSCIFFIATFENIPIGQVRFKIKDGEATISVSVEKEYRKRNLGSEIIRISTQKIFDSTTTKKVHAYVKIDNTVSVLAFQKAKYKILGQCNINDYNSFHLVKEREEINV